MDTRGNGRRSARITSALVGAGGLVVAMVTGVGLWFGHEQAGTTETTTSGTSTENTTSGTSTESGTSTDQGVTQGSTGGTGTSDATTTGS